MVSLGIVGSASGKAVALRPGDIVTIKILKQLPAGKWLAAYLNDTIILSSKLNLHPKEIIKARAFQQNGLMSLRMIEDISEQNRASQPNGPSSTSNEIPTDVLGRGILGALQRSHVPVNFANVKKMRALLHRMGRTDPTAMRLSAMLIEKDADLSPEALNSLLVFADDAGFSGRGRQERRAQRRFSESAIAEAIKKSLKRQIERGSVQDDVLHLFNHLRGKGQNWIIIPYRVTIEDESIEGTIRLNTDPLNRISRCDVGAHIGNERWEVMFDKLLGDAPRMGVRCDNSRKARAFERNRDGMPEKLRNLALKMDDNQEDGEIHWFSDRSIEPIFGVDELA